MSQPAVSAHIHNLEKMLGVKLFDHYGRKTYLTRAGEELYGYSQQILSVIEETLEVMAEFHSPQQGSLSVGADTTVGTYIVPNLLGKFHDIYPEAEISLEVLNHDPLVEELINKRIDMAIMSRVPDQIPVYNKPFAQNELVLVAAPTTSPRWYSAYFFRGTRTPAFSAARTFVRHTCNAGSNLSRRGLSLASEYADGQ